MILATKQLIGCPVETQQGEAIGKVTDCGIDVDTGHLMHLLVRPRRLMTGLLQDELLIPWRAVIRVTAEKIIIQDGSVDATTRAFASRVSQPVQTGVQAHASLEGSEL
jgi:sporulation protein YlmC with PRC-barrel domain